jgi:hypothetical protein
VPKIDVDEVALKVLEEDAQLKNISVSALVNQLILGYANFEHYFTQYLIIKMHSNVFGFLLQGVSDDYACSLGVYVAENFAKFDILSKNGVINLESVIHHLKMMRKYSDDVYRYKEAEVRGKKTLT